MNRLFFPNVEINIEYSTNTPVTFASITEGTSMPIITAPTISSFGIKFTEYHEHGTTVYEMEIPHIPIAPFFIFDDLND